MSKQATVTALLNGVAVADKNGNRFTFDDADIDHRVMILGLMELHEDAGRVVTEALEDLADRILED